MEPTLSDPADEQCPVVTSHTTVTHTVVQSDLVIITLTGTGTCLPGASGAASITPSQPGSQTTSVATGTDGEDDGSGKPAESEATAPPVDGATSARRQDGAGSGVPAPQQSMTATLPEGEETSINTGVSSLPPSPEHPVPTTVSQGAPPGSQELLTTTLPDGRTSIVHPGRSSEVPSSQQLTTSTPPSGGTTTIASGETSQQPPAGETVISDTAASVTTAAPASITSGDAITGVTGSGSQPGDGEKTSGSVPDGEDTPTPVQSSPQETTDETLLSPTQTGESGEEGGDDEENQEGDDGEEDNDDDDDNDGGGGPIPVPGPPGSPNNPSPGGSQPGNNPSDDKPEPSSGPTTTTEGCTTQTATSLLVSCLTLPTPVDGVSVTSCTTTSSEIVTGCSAEQATSTSVAGCSARPPAVVTSHTFEDWDPPAEPDGEGSSAAETSTTETNAAETSTTDPSEAEASTTETGAAETSTAEPRTSDTTPEPKPEPEPEPEPKPSCKAADEERPGTTLEFITTSHLVEKFCETVESQEGRDEDTGAISRHYYGHGSERIRLAIDFPAGAKPDGVECQARMAEFLDACVNDEDITDGGALEVGEVRWRVEPLSSSDLAPGERPPVT